MKQENQNDREIRELDAFAKNLMKEHNDLEVIQRLVKEKGLQKQYATAVVEGIHQAKERKVNFWKSMFMGISAVLGGVLMTLFSYNISKSYDGNSFFLFYGIIAAGIIAILRGFILYK